MILIFPDDDTFRLTLSSGLVPTNVILSPAEFSTAEDGRLHVETTTRLTKKVTADLARLGVVGTKRHAADSEAVSCWLQIVPLTKASAPPAITAQMPVLFEVPSAEEFSSLVGELLRLGNDRQSFRWVAGPTEDAPPRVLLRVLGPPYYSLLRAIDKTSPGLTAFVEQAPRVWVEFGHSHAHGGPIQMPDGEMLLVRAPRDWTYLPDEPFRDVYDVLRFDLPSRPVEWRDTPAGDKLTVPVRLVAGNATDAADLWVLRGGAADDLDTFVREADERDVQRLKFAVGTDTAGGRVIVLRTLPSKLPPPVLPLPDAVGFRTFWKLPNLYVPAGTRLHPNLRRDAVRTLLAADTDHLVWLYPDGPLAGIGSELGGFTPESIPEDSFRPLEDWVDYVIEMDHVPLAAWVEASRFEFDHFICSDQPSPRKKDGERSAKATGSSIETPEKRPGAKPPTAVREQAMPVARPDGPAKPAPKSEWELRRKHLEEQFLAVDGGLDAPERVELWPQLAVANGGFGDAPEAALCWLNALWGRPNIHTEVLVEWLKAEWPDGDRAVTADTVDRLLGNDDPTPGQVRQFAVLLLGAAAIEPGPAWLPARLPRLQRYGETHEHKLPVRLAWLLGSRLAQLTGADVLGLARVRDRILQRLLEHGLNVERDLPVFLRTAGLKDSARIRQVRGSVVDLQRLARGWVEAGCKASATGPADGGATLAYTDLLFAFALGKLGEVNAALGLIDDARAILAGVTGADRAIVADFLFKGFAHRAEQAIAGGLTGGPFPAKLLGELDVIQTKGSPTATDTNSPYKLASYAIARMRDQSRVLEPHEKFDPYAVYQTQSDELKKTLADLPRERDPATIARKLRDLYANGAGGRATPETRFLVILDGLPLAGRIGEAFAVEFLGLVPDVMTLPVAAGTPVPDLPRKQGLLLERALFLAAHFDRREIVQTLVDQFAALVRTRTDDQRYELVNIAAGQCLRSLRKLGLRDEVDRLLQRLQTEVLKGETFAQLKAKFATRPDAWGKPLQTLLHLAGGWLTYGLTDKAEPILEEARAVLIGPVKTKTSPLEFTKLAQAYVSAAGHGPVEDGLKRIVELFQRMDPGRVTNAFTTAQFYSRLHINLVEEVVLAAVSDEFALGPVARRWLDEDEYLVRRRVHHDMKVLLHGSGL